MARTKQTAKSASRTEVAAEVATRGKGAQKVPRVLGVASQQKATGAVAAPRKRRITPGLRALQEIEALQKSTELLVSKSAVVKTSREIAAEFGREGAMRFTPDALCAIHVAMEGFAIEMFDLTNELAIHGKRVTVMPRDMRLMRLIFTRYTQMNLGVSKAADVTTMDEYRAARRHANQKLLAERAARKASKAAAAQAAGVEAPADDDDDEEEQEEEAPAKNLGKRTRGKKDDDENDADASEGGADDDEDKKADEPAKQPAAKRGRKKKEEAPAEKKTDENAEPAKAAPEAEPELF